MTFICLLFHLFRSFSVRFVDSQNDVSFPLNSAYTIDLKKAVYRWIKMKINFNKNA